MPFSHEPSKLTETKPFVIEHQKRDLKPSGQFVPAARLLVTSVLRTSGLLAQLPDAEAKTLLLMLTFLTPNGHIRPSLPELAQALQTSPDKARRRMEQLAELQWAGEPLAHGRTSESSLELWTLSPAVLEMRDAPVRSVEDSAPVYQAAGRDAVIAFSRSHYAVPRAEAERLVAAQYGQDPEEAGEGPEAVARRQLLALGVSRDQVAELFQNYALEDIQNQLNWLKYRGAKSPARFVVAAIQGRYEPPLWMKTKSKAFLEDGLEKAQKQENNQKKTGDVESVESVATEVFLSIPQEIESANATQQESEAHD